MTLSQRSQPPLILTIDDEASVRTSIRDFLEDWDYRVIEAENGREGIEAISRQHPDLVLVDLRMPKVDGLDVLSYVREHTPDTPIVVVSGTGAIGDVVEALRLGAWNYLIKPIQELEVLQHAVEQALERARLIAANRTYQTGLEEKVENRTAALRQANYELTLQHDLIQLKSAEESFLSELSHVSLQTIPMDDYLQQVLDRLTKSVPWRPVLPRGIIFLIQESGPEKFMRLAASTSPSTPECKHCSEIAMCDFGRARTAGVPRTRYLKNLVDACICRHGLVQKGHDYLSAPILHNDNPLGVLVLFHALGEPIPDIESTFLDRICDVLSLGILRRLAEEQAEYLAYSDALTGLANRRLLMDRLVNNVVAAQRQNLAGAILFFDLDHFKTLNDALGHSAGDDLLIQVAQRLSGRVRAIDTVARLGGDEFVVVLPALQGDIAKAGYQAQMLVEELLSALAAPYDINGQLHHLTASAGVALYPHDGDSPEELLRHADSAMYAAKDEGRNTLCFFQPAMQKLASKRLQLRFELRRAIEKNEFELYFQPQFNQERTVTGAEVLLRWNHPQHGLVAPGQFLAAAEESGVILPLGEWVTRTACEKLFNWTKSHPLPESFKLAVNVSPLQFQQKDFVQSVIRIIDVSGIDPTLLCLEITEGALTIDIDDLLEKVKELKHAGVTLAIDDFGTGYSSLARLKKLPINELKIDRSFVTGLPDDLNDAAIVDTILTLARRLMMKVTAEGVETVQQFEYLRKNDCDTFQGFLFARPIPELEFIAYLQAEKQRVSIDRQSAS